MNLIEDMSRCDCFEDTIVDLLKRVALLEAQLNAPTAATAASIAKAAIEGAPVGQLVVVETPEGLAPKSYQSTICQAANKLYGAGTYSTKVRGKSVAFVRFE